MSALAYNAEVAALVSSYMPMIGQALRGLVKTGGDPREVAIGLGMEEGSNPKCLHRLELSAELAKLPAEKRPGFCEKLQRPAPPVTSGCSSLGPPRTAPRRS